MLSIMKQFCLFVWSFYYWLSFMSSCQSESELGAWVYNDKATGWKPEELWFGLWQWQMMFFFRIASDQLCTTPSLLFSGCQELPAEGRWWGTKLTIHFPLLKRTRVSSVILPNTICCYDVYWSSVTFTCSLSKQMCV